MEYYISGDRKTKTTEYSCSNGHKFKKVKCGNESKMEETDRYAG